MKVDFDVFAKFIHDYEQGCYFVQRPGEAFINLHAPDVTDPDLFYEECPIKAEKAILYDYVNLKP